MTVDSATTNHSADNVDQHTNTTNIESMPPKNWKDPSFYRLEKDDDRPQDRIDYRPQGGPLLEHIWCQQELQGQDLYLGAEIGCDHHMYCIPGHAPRVLKVDTTANTAQLMGPEVVGKYKWLRGVLFQGHTIYGLPCHADTVLKIHIPSQQVTLLPIEYETSLADDPEEAQRERQQEWKYHGGNVSAVDECIYAIPQSAQYVLKIDPTLDQCTLVGPKLPGRYKWYGGVVGKQDGAIYGIPHNSPSVLRIHPTEGITLHGNFEGLHKWHGAAAAANGTIVCVAANADSVLCIEPGSPAPTLHEIGDTATLKSGRHRKDRKYKFLGATTGPDGKVYLFPCASERVLAVDATNLTLAEIGPNIYDANMERICQNKWQNGVHFSNSIFGIPLAAESILRINFDQLNDNGEPEITTWKIPAPHRGLSKWEGGVVATHVDNVAYTIPNNHKAVMRIELPLIKKKQQQPTSSSSHAQGTSTTKEEKSDNHSDCTYQSGIPTLRASAHRVKFSLKHRKHDPKPVDSQGRETGTPWLPDAICREEVFSYDTQQYDLRGAVISLLDECDSEVVGSFRSNGAGDGIQLEDFCVPIKSTWRTVNGGTVEDAQRYLSEAVANNDSFMKAFDELVLEVVLPYLKRRLISVGAASDDHLTTFYYQRPPTLRLQPGPARSHVKAHNDAEYGHQNGELNFWIPLTDRLRTGVDLWCESSHKADDYHPIVAKVGEIMSFHGSSCRHYVNANASEDTRVSFDFRVGVQGFFDPTWEMQGTNDDHSRKEARI